MTYKKVFTSWDDIPIVFDLPYVAVILGVCPETARRLVQKGTIKAIKVENQWRINKQDLMCYLGVDKEKSPA